MTYTEMQLNAVLKEYEELRTELRIAFQHQNTMIALIASTLGVLFTVSLNIYISDSFEETHYPLLLALYGAIIPGVIAFLGILWLDQIYRQVKLGTYVSTIERKVNKALGMEGSAEKAAMYWEQWVYNQTKGKSFFLKVNHYQYYYCMGLFALAPIMPAVFSLMLTNKTITELIIPCLTYENFSILLGLVFYILFWIFAGIYAKTVITLVELVGDANPSNNTPTQTPLHEEEAPPPTGSAAP